MRHLTLDIILTALLIVVPSAGPVEAQPGEDSTTVRGVVGPPSGEIVPLPPSLNCIGGAGDGLVLDDGTFAGENGRGNSATPLVTLFSIPNPFFEIDQVCVCLVGDGPTTATFDIVMFDDSGASGDPGVEVARFGPNAVVGIGQFSQNGFTWYDFPLTEVANSGPLYIGIDFVDSAGRYVCGDTSLTFNQTNKYFTSAWLEDSIMDYGIRAEGLVVPVELESFEIEK